ncbi:O-antigen ligase family protein [Clostridium sp. BJN0013]|uniref:O-antigen ligase family protein n=1 Tax=Clostridium sp. BJN0013 TaxID=3236840 RepID=UPI0034C66756
MNNSVILLGYSIKRRKLKFKNIFLIGIIIACVIPKEMNLWKYESYNIGRPYGNSIALSLVMFICIAWFMLGLKKFNISKRSLVNSLCNFLIFGILTIVFPISRSIELYAIGAYKYIFYIILFVLLTNRMDFENFEQSLNIGFRISLVLQSAVGMLYVFFGILIPFISNYSLSERNELSRMTASFSHPGDFSLYISILFLYFICKSLIGRDKSALKYALLGFIDLYLSGARTMLITSFIVAFFIVLKKYKHNLIFKLVSIVTIIFLVDWFIHSSIFQNMFIINSIYDMFMARFVHWIIGFKIMFANIQNFIFGVGLNYHVDYIDANYSNFSELLLKASDVISSDFVRRSPIHNSFLIIGTELGICGLVLYLKIYLKGIRDALVILKRDSTNKTNCYFIIGSFCIFMIYACQGWALMKNFGWTLFILVNAYLFLLKKNTNASKEKERYKL